jgi:hypothetical protein
MPLNSLEIEARLCVALDLKSVGAKIHPTQLICAKTGSTSASAFKKVLDHQ